MPRYFPRRIAFFWIASLSLTIGCAVEQADVATPQSGKADQLGADGAPSTIVATLRFSYFGETSEQELLNDGWQLDSFGEPFFDQSVEISALPFSMDVLNAGDTLSVDIGNDGSVSIDFNNGDNNSFASVQLPTAIPPGASSPQLNIRQPITLSIHGNDNSQFSIDGNVVLSPSAEEIDPPAECCRICEIGQACGDSCISQDAICEVASGCACDA